ncbi:MAG: SH3 domain-containing protein [Thiobacillaceae bacterium]|jgi:SH3-like domain-containing protein
MAAPVAEADLDYVTTGRPAILYDAPSVAATRSAIVGPGYPFEVLVRVENWLKVRDQTGDLLWIESSDAQGKPRVVVTSATANVLEKPQTDAPTRYRVTRGVSLELSGDSGEPGWLRVRHPQGGEGYLSLLDIWGQ